MALLMMLLLVAFPSLPASSASTEVRFKATLHHADHVKSLDSNELFKRALQRSKTRISRRHDAIGIGAHIQSGEGEFFASLAIGTPPEPYFALIDTNSDLTWIYCNPKLCGRRHNNCTALVPSKSSTYSKLTCSDRRCGISTNSSCNAKSKSCVYKYQYTGIDPSWTQGDLATETFTFIKDSVPNLLFGCAYNVVGDFDNLRSGFVGLGRGDMSLISQMKVTELSYCFPSYDNSTQTGMLALGSRGKKLSVHTDIITADIILNKARKSSYYVSLKGIKVNGNALALDSSAFKINADGSGGVAIDSGMTVSYLEGGAYKKLEDAVVGSMNLERVRGARFGLSLCFRLNKKNIDSHFPKIAFSFGNGKGEADLVLSNGNAFRSYSDKKGGEMSCLAMATAPASDGRSSLGNIQLQGTLVVYDLAGNKVSFIPDTACDKL